MPKRGRLSTEDRNYIIENKDMGVEKLAKKLDRRPEMVQTLLNGLVPSVATTVNKNASAVAPSQIIRNDRHIGAVMTEGASQAADELKSSGESRFNAIAIYKPRG